MNWNPFRTHLVIYPLLQIAKLENNKLRSIPDSIGNLNSLQKLNFWKNQLEIFPESIGDLTALQDLDVRENKIKTFPESMVQMKDLKAFISTRICIQVPMKSY